MYITQTELHIKILLFKDDKVIYFFNVFIFLSSLIVLHVDPSLGGSGSEVEKVAY